MAGRILRLFLLLCLLCVASGGLKSKLKKILHKVGLRKSHVVPPPPAPQPAVVPVVVPVVTPQPNVPRFTLVAPDLLRADSQENIYLQAEGIGTPVEVHITIMDFGRITTLLTDKITLDQGNNFHALQAVQMPSGPLNRDETKNKYVWLMVNFVNYHKEERIVLVSFHSGYIFIQTDKPIYNPGDEVRLRAFVSSPSFKAFDSSLTIDVQNPEGVVVKQVFRSRAPYGVFSDSFLLPEFANEGTWKVIAKFDHWKQNTFTSQLEVKKYVLPAFNVTLTPRKFFLSLDDDNLEVEISARYLYGEPVQGTAYVVFGVDANKEMTRLPSVKQVSNLEGGVVTLSMDELKRAYPNMRTLVGSSIYIKASVLTKTGSDLVEAEKKGISIVESPYILSFKDTPKYYKPGLPFDFTIQVTHHDGSPARNVPVKVNLLEGPVMVGVGTARVTINLPNVRHPQGLSAETTQAGLKPEQQAKNQMFLFPYLAMLSQSYLYISTSTNTPSVGDTLSLKLTIAAEQIHRDNIQHVTYLVVNKGKIIEAKRMGVSGQLVTSIGLTVTPEMMPSFRFVAFYNLLAGTREEVVADSIWVDVSDSCIGDLKVGPADGVPRDYAPGKRFSVRVRGNPGANVSLVAVDNSVYLLRKDRLTQKKMWDIVEHGDMGCTRGGGINAKGVFKDAGLMFSSSTGFKTDSRNAQRCPVSNTRRRSAERLQRKVQLESHYKEQLQHRCCRDGLRDVPMPYSCTRRSLYITEGWECIRAFRYCCATYRDQVLDTELPTTFAPTTVPPTTTPMPTVTRLVTFGAMIPLRREMFDWGRGPPGPERSVVAYSNAHKTIAAPEVYARRPNVVKQEAPPQEAYEEYEEYEEEEYLEEADVYLRSKFFESWLWTDINLPSIADSDGLASKDVTHALPDSITEWGVLAISSSPHTGFCVAEPYNVRAWKRFFVDLKLPYSVARNEQVEIKAVIHNYGYDDLHVRVVLMKTEDMCSIAFKDRHTQEVTLAAGTSKAVPYTIMPLAVGKLPIEVMVVARDMMGGDRVQKLLRVVMDGVQKTKVRTTVLNPSAEGGRQMVQVGKVDLEGVVPNSAPETFINVRGNVLADSIDNSISDDSLASLIRMPGGCVEQNLATITLPLIATLYLERTDDWESVGVLRKADALRYIRRGYENQLAYKKMDGSYPPYRREGASTWITAYVVKVFSMAHSIIGIDTQQVCDPLNFLVGNKHRLPRGHFVEDNPVYSTTMTGGLRGDDPETTLTAFVLIALAEAKQAGIRCSGPSLEAAIGKTAEYLKRALMRTGRRPYTVAITSYALALVGLGPDYDPTTHLRASGQGSHWPDKHNHLFTLEATGYALLALVKLGHMTEAEAAFKWLNSQRRIGGGFGSTQSTMVVLQALSEYLIHTPSSDDLSLNVDVRITGRRDIRYHFNPRTAYAAQSSRLPAHLNLTVEVTGKGQGILEVVTYYNQLHEVDEKIPCKNFELGVAIEEASEKPPADMEKSYQMTIKVRALGPSDVRMVVLDVSLPTGFTPENADLEMLSNSVDRYISNFKMVDNLSDRGSLIIHLFKVSHKEPEILVFRLQQNFKVGLLQPSSVTVYEYYNPDHRCSKTYTPTQHREDLTHICKENVCRCTQGDCCIAKGDSEDFVKKERETFACKSLHHVFQVKVVNASHSYYDKYEMEITRVIKLGVEAGVETGQRRFFTSHGGCREGLDLKIGSQYLIIGPKEDKWDVDSDTNRFVYTLGKTTWVERWPSPAECARDLQAKCTSLDAAAKELFENACRL
ncbi:complement C3-like [Dunckerocampus dactyliophorus]|uniref:complement C3-like n=1 Tax=Dunckerocampus dactyliophorus TaxID=161453 RepID=UPI0024074E52|nr:complement C3-like [Dunckerocampus dactyliophorus]